MRAALPGREQLTPNGQRGVPYHEVLCETVKLKGLAGGLLLLRDWLSIVWQAVSNCVVHHLLFFILLSLFSLHFLSFPTVFISAHDCHLSWMWQSTDVTEIADALTNTKRCFAALRHQSQAGWQLCGYKR